MPEQDRWTHGLISADVDPSGLHIDEQFLQGRPIHRAAGKAAIVVTVPDQPPALVSLALDVRLARSR